MTANGGAQSQGPGVFVPAHLCRLWLTKYREQIERTVEVIPKWEIDLLNQLALAAFANGNGDQALSGSGNGTADAACTVAEAAQLRGVTESRVRQLCRTGELAARKHGRTWIIDLEAATDGTDEHPKRCDRTR